MAGGSTPARLTAAAALWGPGFMERRAVAGGMVELGRRALPEHWAESRLIRPWHRCLAGVAEEMAWAFRIWAGREAEWSTSIFPGRCCCKGGFQRTDFRECPRGAGVGLADRLTSLLATCSGRVFFPPMAGRDIFTAVAE